MTVMRKNLTREFERAAQAPPGDCPLPEPGRGAPAIEQVGLISIRQQPDKFDYDAEGNKAEQVRFVVQTMAAVAQGKVSFVDGLGLLLRGDFLP